MDVLYLSGERGDPAVDRSQVLVVSVHNLCYEEDFHVSRTLELHLRPAPAIVIGNLECVWVSTALAQARERRTPGSTIAGAGNGGPPECQAALTHLAVPPG